MDIESFITTSAIQTKKLGKLLAEKLCGGEIICLSGDLGAGKTTFTQGLLKGLRIKGPYTSPTFAILKVYEAKTQKNIGIDSNISRKSLQVYHIDAYRITSKDLVELGFKDFAGKKNTITIIEWPTKVKRLIPTEAVWINFEWISEKERKVTLTCISLAN